MIQYLIPASIIAIALMIIVSNAAMLAVLSLISERLKRVQKQNEQMIWQNNKALDYAGRSEKREIEVLERIHAHEK